MRPTFILVFFLFYLGNLNSSINNIDPNYDLSFIGSDTDTDGDGVPDIDDIDDDNDGRPQTNGMVERVNGTIKNATILREVYKTKEDMLSDLNFFLTGYVLYRRHGGLRRELNVKTPFNAIQKWYELKPEIFKQIPSDFKLNFFF